jgi:hypothetical protein
MKDEEIAKINKSLKVDMEKAAAYVGDKDSKDDNAACNEDEEMLYRSAGIDTAEQREVREHIESYSQMRTEAIIIIKVIGLVISLALAGTFTGIAADKTFILHIHKRRLYADLGLFFWGCAVFFLLTLRREICQLIYDSAHAFASTLKFLKIWHHTVINTTCAALLLTFIIMSFALSDIPNLQDNKVFLAFYGIIGGSAALSFCCGGYNLLCLKVY